MVVPEDRSLLLGGLLSLLGQKHSLDVGQNATLGDGHATEQLVQLLVVADGQLEMAGDDTSLLVVSGSVAGQLEDLSGQVFENGRQVDRRSGTDALSVVAFPEKPVHTADGELQPSAGRASLGLGSRLSAGFASARHGGATELK